MSRQRVLILGGTGDAAELVARVAAIPEIDVITSLAGRTHPPVLPAAQTRIGGFGGAAGLADYLQAQQIDRLIDATHPFATQISRHAAIAAAELGIPRLMLIRPAWKPVLSITPGAPSDRWIEVESCKAAAAALPGLAQRIFLAIGRQEISTFAPLLDLWFLMRMIEPPLPEIPRPPGKVLLERGPFSLEAEQSLLQQHDIGAIVSKNSGGDATYAKIAAARELGIPVVMVQRPPIPDGEQVTEIESALSWIKNRL